MTVRSKNPRRKAGIFCVGTAKRSVARDLLLRRFQNGRKRCIIRADKTKTEKRRTEMETIGKNVKRLRGERKWTQEELAERLNVSAQAILKWENGNGLPDISQVVPLANVFGVSTDVLFGLEGTDDSDRVAEMIRDAYAL